MWVSIGRDSCAGPVFPAVMVKKQILYGLLLLKQIICARKQWQILTVDGLVITNYRESGGLPLRNIMRLPEKKRFFGGETFQLLQLQGIDRYGDYF